MKNKYIINNDVRLIEFFSGIGAQANALRNLGVPFEHYFTCEWEINACASYKNIYMKDDKTDYSAPYTKEGIVDFLVSKGISNDGKVPMNKETLAKKNEAWLRTAYNNICATHNLVDITKVKGEDLKIVDWL